MSKRPDLSRTSTQGIDAPVKVVGFHVEGTSPSPSSDTVLKEAVKSGSLSPVIIPPSFQGQRTPDTSPRQLRGDGGRNSLDRQQQGGGSRSESGRTSPVKSSIGQVATVSGQGSRRSSLESPTSPSGPPAVQAAPVGRQVSYGNEALPLTPVGREDDNLASEVEGKHVFSSREQREPSQTGVEQSALYKTSSLPKAETGHTAASTEKQRDESKSKTQHDHGKKKPMTKAERRALQEAQRAAKAAAKGTQSSQGGQKSTQPASAKKDTLPSQTNVQAKDQKKKQHAVPSQPSAFFDHLPKYSKIRMEDLASNALEKCIPVECVRLGVAMLDGTIRGTNKRSMAFLEMIDSVISSLELSPGQSFTREFTQILKNMVSFLVACRPLSPAVGNVVKSIKAELGHLNSLTELSNEEAKSKLQSFIATYMQDKITFARITLAKAAAEKIHDGDIILTFARSTTVEATLLAAAEAGKKFSVVIADTRPLLEGRDLLTILLRAGIPCEYLLLNSLETGMNQANKVMLGAAGVMSNGAVLSRSGTATVAMSASLAHIPVLVCAETYKFHERVQLDSITHNELGDPMVLLDGVGNDAENLKNMIQSDEGKVSLLNIVYDTTPAEYVSVVMTEVGALPPTSVPVVLREYRSDTEMLVMNT